MNVVVKNGILTIRDTKGCTNDTKVCTNDTKGCTKDTRLEAVLSVLRPDNTGSHGQVILISYWIRSLPREVILIPYWIRSSPRGSHTAFLLASPIEAVRSDHAGGGS